MPIANYDKKHLDKERYIPDIRELHKEPEEKQRDFIKELNSENND